MNTSERLRMARDKLILLSYFICAVICLACVFQKDSVVSVCFYTSFFVIFYLFARYSSSSVRHFSKELLFIIALSIINVVINQLVAGSGIIGFDYFKKVIMFLTTVIFFYYVSYDANISEKIKDRIVIIVLGIAALYSLLYITNRQQCMLFHERVSKYLTFGMTNPNLTGIYMLCIEAYCVIAIFRFGKLVAKAIALLLSVAMAYFLFLTNARNAMIALVLFYVLAVVMIVRKKTFGNFVTTAILWYPLTFFVIYLFIIHNEKVTNLLSFLVSEGKTLDTRYDNWSNTLDILSKSPIIGVYCEISNGTGMSQMLNTHLDVLASYGIVVFILFMSFLRKIGVYTSSVSNSSQNFIALAGFFACIIAGSGEAALVSGGTGIYILIGGLLLFARDEIPKMIS